MDGPGSTDGYQRPAVEHASTAADEGREAEALDWAEALIGLDD